MIQECIHMSQKVLRKQEKGDEIDDVGMSPHAKNSFDELMKRPKHTVGRRFFEVLKKGISPGKMRKKQIDNFPPGGLGRRLPFSCRQGGSQPKGGRKKAGKRGERGGERKGPHTVLRPRFSQVSVGHPASLFTSQLNGGGWRAFLKEERVLQAIKRHGLLSHLHCT